MVNIAPWKAVLTVLVCILGFVYASPNVIPAETRIWMQENMPSWMPTKTINLGLDLRGGAHLLYEVDVEVAVRERAQHLEEDLREVFRSKYKQLRHRRAVLPDGVRIILYDRTNGEDARRELRKSNPNLDITTSDDGLEIKAVFNEDGIREIYDQVISQSIEIVRRRIDELGTTEPIIQRQGDDRILIQAPGADAESLKNIIGTTAKLTFHLLKEPGSTGYSKTFPMAEDPRQTLEVETQALITGDMLENAAPAYQDGQPVISFRLDNTGGRRFADVTRKNVGKPFAIVLDGQILSAPVIREPILGGSGQISGGFSVQEASDLSLLLRAGALPAPMGVVEERTVGPSLGADSVEAGRLASIYGLILVLVFMAVLYGLFGLMANVALAVNVALIFAVLSGLQATLTLPGIAGIVLTIGMAVDANVLIFERIREELAAGRTPISAIDAGYSRAMSTIIDSNLTTLIAAFILFSFGTGPIKGFAVTLGIGIVTSFFTAIMVTRLLVISWLRKRRPETLPV